MRPSAPLLDKRRLAHQLPGGSRRVERHELRELHAAALRTRHARVGRHVAPAARGAQRHHDAVERHGDLLFDEVAGQVDAVAREQGEAHDGLARGAGVQRGERAVVARAHGLQHVDALGAAHLAHHDAVRAHAQGVGHQVANRDGALALDGRLARLQAHHVRMARELELGGVLDGYDALVERDLAGQGV